jgi:hypothetical protein
MLNTANKALHSDAATRARERRRSGKDIELAGGLFNTQGDVQTSSMLQDGMRMGMLKLCPPELKTASPPSIHHNQVKD